MTELNYVRLLLGRLPSSLSGPLPTTRTATKIGYNELLHQELLQPSREPAERGVPRPHGPLQNAPAHPDICHGTTCIKGHFRPLIYARRLGAMNAETTPALQATNIHQSFGHVDALRGVNLTLMPGEIVALLGVNGAGKSTFLDIVLGLATPTQGDISVYGMSPREAVRRSLVGAMLQSGALPRDGKVRNTIDLVAAMHADPIPTDELLERTNLTKLAKRPLNKLSGGEVQRVRLALALSGNPDFLILDEATAGMDALARRAFWDTMHAEAAEGRTLLFATHYLTEARKEADRIVIIDAGKVLLDAPTEQVVADNEDLEDVFERITSHADAE